MALAGAACSRAPASAQAPSEIRHVLSRGGWSRDAAAFYEARAYRSAWFQNGRLTPSYLELARNVGALSEHGLNPLDYALPVAEEANARAEVQTTETALRLARHLLRGRIDPQSVYYGWSLSRRERNLPADLAAAIDGDGVDDLFRALAPRHEGYETLKKALATYRRLQSSGGWPAVDTRLVLHPGDTSEAVDELRRRLQITNNVPAPTDGAAVYDDQLVLSVHAFQAQHGLEVDGIVGRRTFEALNVPVERRILEIEVNLERWRWMPERRERKYVEINIPAYGMRLVEEGRDVMRMKVIVGTPATRTPVFSTRIEEVVLAPYWVVPRSIEVNEILPKLSQDPGYLQRHDMRRLANGMLRQDPGPSNPLGRIKFTIPNPYGVGLHDTPQRYLFERAICAFSHGCMRLQRPEDLALHLLKETEWSRSRIQAAISTWKERRIPLEQPVPLHVLYWTAWVDEDGGVQFRADVYGYDDSMIRALNAK